MLRTLKYNLSRILWCYSIAVSVAQAAPIISFGLPAYGSLGGVGAEVRGAYQALTFTQTATAGSISTASAILANVSAAGSFVNGNTFFSSLAAFGSAATVISSAPNAQSIANLAGSVGSLNFSPQYQQLSSGNQQLAILAGQVAVSIDPPTLALYYAAAVSGTARAQVIETAKTARQGLASLDPIYRSIDSTDAYLRASRGDLVARLSQGDAAANAINQYINDFNSIILTQMLTEVLANEAQIRDLISNIDTLLAKLPGLRTNVVGRAGDLDTLIQSLDFALTASVPSSWTTAGYGSLITDRYLLDFNGRSFPQPYIEIEGPFLLGTLSLTNFVSPGSGSLSFDTVNFEVEREVKDPLLGLVRTVGRVPLTMLYFATPNSADPVASADFFYVPSLGIDVSIYEGSTFMVNVYGQYASPLQIVALEPASGGGFISPTSQVPEPTTAIPVLFCLILAFSRKRRANNSLMPAAALRRPQPR